MSRLLQVAVVGGTVLVGWAVMKATTPTKESMMKVSQMWNYRVGSTVYGVHQSSVCPVLIMVTHARRCLRMR